VLVTTGREAAGRPRQSLKLPVYSAGVRSESGVCVIAVLTLEGYLICQAVRNARENKAPLHGFCTQKAWKVNRQIASEYLVLLGSKSILGWGNVWMLSFESVKPEDGRCRIVVGGFRVGTFEELIGGSECTCGFRLI
jgi:hypothetical protein